MASSSLAGTLRRSLLIKVISKPAPSREDVASVIELTSAKVVEALNAQSMTLYLVEGNDIVFKQVYYSPTLWAKEPAKEKQFDEKKAKLLALKLPLKHGDVGKVIDTGTPLFFDYKDDPARMAAMTKMTGFEVRSMLTVALKTTITLGAIQVLNKELSAGTDGEFTEKDLSLLQEVAEYSSTLIHRMVDPKFVPNADDTARFISKLTDLPLVTKIEEIEIDEKLIEVTGDAIIRREGIFPHKQLSPNSVAVVMMNPLDYAKRESFMQATETNIDEVCVVSATLFEALLKKYPNSRYLDLIEARRFSIAEYWLKHHEDHPRPLLAANLTDRSRPTFDEFGHAVRVFDRIRIDDPTGKLADDATLAAANAYFSAHRYMDADNFYTDLRKTFPNSEHQFAAHYLGLKAKLLSYQGSDYSGVPLSEAEKLVQQMRRQFPQQAAQEQEFLSRAYAEVRFKKGEREWKMASYHQRRSEYGAARFYYDALVKNYTDTPFAERAQEQMVAIGGKPPVPPQRFTWLVDAFPKEENTKPLIATAEAPKKR